MKIKKLIIQFGLISTIALSGCNIYTNTYSNYDKSVDFTKYKTYAWLSSQKSQAPSPYYNDVIENNAKSYVDHHFKDRGYSIDTLNPDVLLELVLKSEKQKEQVNTRNPYNYSNYTLNNYPYNHNYNDNLYYDNQNYNRYLNYNYNRHYSYNRSYRTKTMKYMKSAITINVIDRASNNLVWTGTSENDIYDPEYLKDEIHPAVVNILKQYPVKPTEKTQTKK
jgi:hypothetical protein